MNARAIFDAAMDISDPTDRAAYLDRACDGNASLRRSVEEVIAAQDQLGNFLDQPAVGPAHTPDGPSAAEGPGTIIGSYKLLEQIGEGGFGIVFMAEQSHPVRRKVALKVLKPG